MSVRGGAGQPLWPGRPVRRPLPGRQRAQSGRQPLPMYSATSGAPMYAQALTIAGGSAPHNNLMPYLTLTFIIALQGVYPPRS